MAAWLDGCRFSPTAGSTTDWTYSAAVVGYQSPASAGVVNGTVYKYRAESADLSQWELGEGAYNTGTGVLARTTVLYNSSGTGTGAGQSGAGTKINFSTVPQVAIVALKEDMLSIEEANSFTAAQKSHLRANMDLMRFNYIINGAMMVSQENGTTAGTTSGYYSVDQFRVDFSNAGAVSIAQVASITPSGSPNRLRVTVTTADASVGAGDYTYIMQGLEGLRIADLKFGSAAPKQITIQFGCKGPAGTYCVALRNSANNRAYNAEYTIAAGEANTDAVKSVTLTGDATGTWLATNGAGIYLSWGLMVGSTFQQAAGSWGATNTFGSSNQFNFMGTNGNVFELFDVGLYEGSVAPAFKVPDFYSELTLSQEFYRYADGMVGVADSSTTTINFHCQLNPPMRSAPTATVVGTLSTSDDYSANPSAASPTISAQSLSAGGGRISIGGFSGLTSGRFYGMLASANVVRLNARL